MTDTELQWFKSSYSAGDSNECVEVAAAPGAIHVRDSKNKSGERLAFPCGPWADFLAYASGR